jgi:hypothetical protein
LPLPGLVRDDDDVVGVLEIALADALLVDQVVGQLELVEREPHPADVLRAAPGAVDRDARQIEIVHRTCGAAARPTAVSPSASTAGRTFAASPR